LNKFKNLEELILPTNSCPIEINKGTRGGIRFKMDNDGFDVLIRNANDDAEYTYCNR
jgi:hypothetical protein